MAKFCEHCGSPLEAGQQVCLKCGRILEQEKPEKQKKPVNKANRGLILGICSFIAWIIPLFGYPVTIFAAVYSYQALKENTKEKEKAYLGLLFGILFFIATLVNSIMGVLSAI